MSQSSKISERMLAHARLCREIAGDSWNEVMAEKLKQLAEECTRTAATAGPDPEPEGPIH